MSSRAKDLPHLIGILNVTPDSFSDGGRFLSKENAIRQAKLLHAQGASIIDIGADSTRPGSVCVGPAVEKQRLTGLIREISEFTTVSVDTHHAETARMAIEEGASIINDVSCGYDPQMLQVAAASGVRIILTFTRCAQPHTFDASPSGDIVEAALKNLSVAAERAQSAGVRKDKILLDPGMGAYLSDEPMVSFQMLAGLRRLRDLGYPLVLGISRKGFLKAGDIDPPAERDLRSAMLSSLIHKLFFGQDPVYFRVHEAALHKLLFA